MYVALCQIYSLADRQGELGQDEALKFGLVKTDEEIQRVAREAGFNFSAEEFFSVTNEMPDEAREIILGDLLGGTSEERSSFCRGCVDKGSNFCITVCFWINV